VGKLQFVAINVEGTEEAVSEAFKIAAKILDRNGAEAVGAIHESPVESIAIAAPGKHRCKQCPETFEKVGKLAAHTRRAHPKKERGLLERGLSSP